VQISMQLNYAGGYREAASTVERFEKAGLDMVWIAEAYGFDGPSLMGYVAATTSTIQIAAGILPIYTRTPTLLAQTAAGIDALSDGRFQMGLGASGPQVIEGWHGLPYDKPLTRTREIIDICRKIWKREEKLTYDGRAYQLPLPEGQGTGLGKPLKIIYHPLRPSIPIWVASLGPKNVEMTAEVADGWLPLFYVPEKAHEVWGDDLARGAAKRDASLGPLEISAGGLLAIGDDAAGFREFARPMAARYIGGMGAKGRNFYNDLVCRYGFEEAAAEIQDLYLEGKKEEAAAKVPDDLLELTNLCGPEGYVKERIAAYKEAGVTNLQVIPLGADPAELITKVKELSA
jgi:F420-dependent oxidoreductase-like protein